MNKETEKIASEIIVKNFDLTVEEENLKMEEVKKYLKEKITELMNTNMERLFSILYRIDIKEEKAMEALAKTNAAEELTDLIIQRQIEKVITRNQYR